MKKYSITVKLTFENYITAKNKKQAVNITKESFENEFNIKLHDNEIIKVEEI